jgi:hypothetical protein
MEYEIRNQSGAVVAALVQMKGLSEVCWHAALGEGRQWASRRASTSCSNAGTSTAR